MGACRAEREWTRRFQRGAAPGEPARDGAGRCAARLGRVVAVEYERNNGGRRETRRHEFEDDAAPTLVRARGGKAQLTGGSYSVSSERGIVDMAKKRRKKGRRTKRNPFRGGSGDRVMKFVETAATTGVTAVGANVLSKVLVDRYTDWEPRTKAFVRAAAQIGLGIYLAPKFPRMAAGIAFGGAIIGAEELSTSLEVEQQLTEALPARTTTTTTTSTGATPGATGVPQRYRQLNDGARIGREYTRENCGERAAG